MKRPLVRRVVLAAAVLAGPAIAFGTTAASAATIGVSGLQPSYAAGSAVSFEVSIIDAVGGETCILDWGDGTAWESCTPDPALGVAAMTHVYPVQRQDLSYTINMFLSDGAARTAAVSVLSDPAAPLAATFVAPASGSITEGPHLGLPNVFLNGTGTTSATTVAWSYSWLSGPTHPQAICRFTAPARNPNLGAFTVQLSCEDDGVVQISAVLTDGAATATASIPITVTDVPTTLSLLGNASPYAAGAGVGLGFVVDDPGRYDNGCAGISWGDSSAPEPCASGPVLFGGQDYPTLWFTATHVYPTASADATYIVTATDLLGQSVTTAVTVLADAPAVPGAPTITALRQQDRDAVVVSFTPPADSGAGPITGYTASCTNVATGGTKSRSRTTSPIKVDDLDRNGTFSCTVTATNAIGTSEPSAPAEITLRRRR